MASGEVATREPAELPRGYVVTSSGRVSGVTEPGEVSVTYPFSVNDLVRLDDALKYGSRKANARFEESAPLGVKAAQASFNYGNLMTGLVAAIDAMSAGVSPA